jgi:SAM-dependent methyltransferase
MSEAAHRELILDQFSRQAGLFSSAAPITDETALETIIVAAKPGPEDRLLDLACGGGIVVCAFAPHLREAVGIDMTPAMLDRARQLASEKRLDNVRWHQGDAGRLPFPDNSFTIVTTRYSFHHFHDPAAVLRGMLRVCAPKGRILVIDTQASEDKGKAAEFNRLEVLRDPSHVRALSLTEMRGLFRDAGLGEPQTSFYELRDTVENLLARSFPNPGDEEKIVELFRASVEDDRLGIPVAIEGGAIRYAYPVMILCAQCPKR